MEKKYSKDLSAVVRAIKSAKDRGKSCCLLIGAGCSATAGVPIASKIVEQIKTKYPDSYNRAEKKDYPHCMGELLTGERDHLIIKAIENAKINWAHICIAQLIHKGYVDRVLTTNFDPLLMRTTALLGEFPAIYDFAASGNFDPDKVAEKAVFHLHGQHTGFALLHTSDQMRAHSKRLKPVFAEANQGRVWIVVGYSGESDPVFEHLAKIKLFKDGLFWIGYKDNAPSANLRDRLLATNKSAFFTPGYDADSFFVELTQELEIFPPEFVEQPFHHLRKLFEDILPLKLKGDQEQGKDLLDETRNKIQAAIKLTEKEKENSVSKANRLLMSGDYDAVIKFCKNRIEDEPKLTAPLADAHFQQGCDLSMHALNSIGEKAETFHKKAIEKYQAALKIKPDLHQALGNWGNALGALAKTKTEKVAEKLYSEAIEKYQAALKIKPDKHEALCNWGVALSALADSKTGKEAEKLRNEAIEKYQAALKIKPDLHQALGNWGVALGDLADSKTGKEAEKLRNEAIEKYQAALKIKPDYHQALGNWGATLSALADSKTGKEAEKLCNEAIEKYQAALKIKPDDHEALGNWGATLGALAKTKTGKVAEKLRNEAIEKYQAVLKIKPDKHEALCNWGVALGALADSKTGKEAEKLCNEAIEKYQAALKIKPDYHQAHFNMACAYALLNDEKQCRLWLEKRIELGPLTDANINDTDLDSMRDKDWFKKLVPKKRNR